VGQDVKSLGVINGQSGDGSIVLAENDQILIATFHPELTQNDLVHRYFIDKVRTKSEN
jgi:glutamine amidotransferase PdxT